jgi:hypothetical protein
MNKNITIDQNANNGKLLITTHQGKRKLTSKSKIINRIATR